MYPKNFNLLISTIRRKESDACAEIWYFLKKLGDYDPPVNELDIPGLIVANTDMDPLDVIHKLRSMLLKDPKEFIYILKVTPLQKLVKSNVENIKLVALDFASKILIDENYKIAIGKRRTSISKNTLIDVIAGEINRKVNLDKPDKIILIEIIGKFTGISLISPKDILAVVKEKRAML